MVSFCVQCGEHEIICKSCRVCAECGSHECNSHNTGGCGKIVPCLCCCESCFKCDSCGSLPISQKIGKNFIRWHCDHCGKLHCPGCMKYTYINGEDYSDRQCMKCFLQFCYFCQDYHDEDIVMDSCISCEKRLCIKSISLNEMCKECYICDECDTYKNIKIIQCSSDNCEQCVTGHGTKCIQESCHNKYCSDCEKTNISNHGECQECYFGLTPFDRKERAWYYELEKCKKINNELENIKTELVTAKKLYISELIDKYLPKDPLELIMLYI